LTHLQPTSDKKDYTQGVNLLSEAKEDANSGSI